MIFYKKFSILMHAILLVLVLVFASEQVDCSVSLKEACSIIDHLDAADDLSGIDVDGDTSIMHYNEFSLTTVPLLLAVLFFTVYAPPLRHSIYRPPKA